MPVLRIYAYLFQVFESLSPFPGEATVQRQAHSSTIWQIDVLGSKLP